ncbi:hypothetical protein KDW_49970 [Dictyobacter vulcani]|uniref:Uncharacterized protein n=1 Tax=Dictyobacter vulcani TaxID=2607529 RepID=A0A5J4KSG4_9CHLR|nr:hypothetical protein [Dictyobacter vulcani]GER90835.1 hypothetical protein KDW_49970 [Dictyobacter vulcani]
MDISLAVQKSIVAHIQQFLQIRRRRWTGMQAFLAESQLSRPELFLLRALDGETVSEQSLTVPQMRADLFNPYATEWSILDYLPHLVELDYLQQQDNGYIVTEAGRTLINRMELAARAYLGSLEVPASIALSELAEALVERVHRSWQAAEPVIKAHQARTQRRLPVQDAPALVQIDWAILGLWEARDDAHMAAWRARGFSGPVFDLLSRIWAHEAHTLSSLVSLLTDSQTPADIQQGLQELTGLGLITTAADQLELTPQGQQLRDDIERETDRIFFASWDQVDNNKANWLVGQLSQLCAYFRER